MQPPFNALLFFAMPNSQLDPEWTTAPNHHILTLDHPSYPTLLKEIPDPPKKLYIMGDPLILNQPQFAIVGSRNPTVTGCEIAQEMAEKLVQAGFHITSGLALGIDAASHRGALKAGGKTIAVLGSGLTNIYPRRHHRLAEQISQKGALVSEFPLTMPPLPTNFPRRNRIISGLSLGTLVVEATLGSGSLITAKLAAEQNREVFAIPGSIRNPLSQGCHALIKEGAKLVDSIGDIIAELSYEATGASAPIQALDKNEHKLLECIGFEVTSIDQLIARSGFSASIVASLLLRIELQGHIKSTPGGVIRVK
ncbi:DNA-processing protein DprA [Coxiella burnetii]|uniref:DNA-processing protein DprA n=1 Tax=Coxiella burnetii TaxID=777 RepID=UPI00057CAC00|nr:DNA-processing protein DprA [Coxiella burnetii]